MNTLEKYQADVEAAQKLLERAISSFEEAKKQEEESKAIKLKVPKDGELYTDTVLRYPTIRHEADMNDYFLCTFASTNKKQSESFADALVVMAEMRMQDGIVVPNGNDDFYSISTEKGQKISIDMWSRCFGLSLFPAFDSKDAAQTAINAVGEHRIINCIKTMMFMTPESRGEV